MKGTLEVGNSIVAIFEATRTHAHDSYVRVYLVEMFGEYSLCLQWGIVDEHRHYTGEWEGKADWKQTQVVSFSTAMYQFVAHCKEHQPT